MFIQRKYNTATVTGTHIRLPMIKRGAADFAIGTDWTPAAGDVKIAKDGGASINIASLPAAVTVGNSAYWEFPLSASELSCKQLVVTISDGAPKAVEDNMFIVETFGNAAAMMPADLSDGARLGLTSLPNAVPAAAGGLATVNAGNLIAGIQGTKNTFDSLNDLSALQAENAVLDADVAAHHTTSGSAGQQIHTSASAGYPWSTALPGAYASGTAGNIIGINLDMAVSSRLGAGSYVAPDNAGISAIKASTDNLPAQPAAVGSVMSLDMLQPVPLTNSAQTLGDALNAARAIGFGKWVVDGAAIPPTFTLYAPDGATPIHIFQLDSALTPTQRN